MRVFCAAVMIALLTGPAYAQSQSVPKYGEFKDKSPQEIAAEREADKAYKKSLGNIPEKGPADPWGNVRSDSAPLAAEKTGEKAVAKNAVKNAAKDAAPKRAKTGGAAN